MERMGNNLKWLWVADKMVDLIDWLCWGSVGYDVRPSDSAAVVHIRCLFTLYASCSHRSLEVRSPH